MALGMLAGAVFLCARPAAGAGSSVVGHAGHAAAERVFCVSPQDLPGCSPLSHVTPGVLPAPPPAVVMAGGAPLAAGRTAHEGRVRPPSALARGPDLHALQVLRT
ncbi:hypothetical protein ACFXDJ_13140 [Streptomyces sp. NPDC059443]|uniref:hypothetical protein n=1 Tax=unclassified Streptomyces TaxID=2593676 RepID=UPI0036B735E7